MFCMKESPLCGDLIFMQADKRIPADLIVVFRMSKKGYLHSQSLRHPIDSTYIPSSLLYAYGSVAISTMRNEGCFIRS